MKGFAHMMEKMARMMERLALRGAADDPRPDKSDWIRIWAAARTQLDEPTDAQEWARALAAEEGPVSEPPPQGAPLPPEGTVARAAWDSGAALWRALRTFVTRPSDLDYHWHEEWPALPSALRGQLAYAAEEAMSRHEPAPPAPANPYPLRTGTERFEAQAQLVNALAEVRRLESMVERLDYPLLLGYAGVAVTTLEHVGRALEQSPNPYPRDEGIIAKGEQP